MRPNNFNDLLELQKQLDEAVSEERENGFIPRKRTEFDLRMALDDEFNEFMKELPQELNFKYWKEIKHDPEKQLEEFVDCLFFILAALNEFRSNWMDHEIHNLSLEFDKIEEMGNEELTTELLSYFKEKLIDTDLSSSFDLESVIIDYFYIANCLDYNKEIILETYYKKWKKNIKRIKGDWSL